MDHTERMARQAVQAKLVTIADACTRLHRDCGTLHHGKITDAEFRKIEWLVANIRIDVAIVGALRQEFPGALIRTNPAESVEAV